MGAGFSTSESDQRSESNTGVTNDYRPTMSYDAFNQSQRMRDYANQSMDSPFGYFQGRNIRDLIPQNQYGLPIQTTEALAALGNSWFNKASAGGSMRGQNSPENTNQIVGSSMLNASQFLMPHILQNQQYLNGLPDQLNAQRLGYLQADQESRARLLGSSSSGSGSGYGFGMQMSMGGGGAR